MSNIYQNQIDFAKRFIREKGQQIVWKKMTSSIADVNKPWDKTLSVETTYQPYAVILPLSSEGRGRVGSETNNYRSNQDIPAGALLGYMEAVDFQPSINDIVVIGGVEMKLKNFDEINPNGEGSIFYTLEIVK